MERPDVLIVGSGPAGAVAAKRFAAAGFSVVCMEQGDFPDYTSAPPDRDDWELAKERWFAWNPNRRKGVHDYPVNDAESDISPLMWNGVGGSSIIYGAAWHRLRPSDFRVRSLDGVAEDWPLTYEDLEPFYRRVEVDFAVSGVPGDPAYPPGFDPPLPPLPMGSLERRFAAAHDRLGWHYWPGSNAIASVKTGSLAPCVRRGACGWGCFDGAKASVDRTHWPANRALGVTLMTQARVVRVESDSQGLVTGVTYVDRTTGRERFQAAATVVLAANGLGTPRLLLNSTSKSHPHGLANSSDLVGRHLMMHPLSTVVGLFDDFFESWQGPNGQRAYSLEFGETGASRDHVRGAKWQLMPTGGPLNLTGPYPFGDRDGAWGRDFHATVRTRFGRSAFWAIIAEDLPDAENRVVLDPDLTDSDGFPAPKVLYRNSHNTELLLRFHEGRAEQSMREAGAYDVLVAPHAREVGWHLLGTARMGKDPATSVVDGFGRAHDAPNLFIVDGSVMPTSGPVNPTGTVAALALRAAEHAITSARDQRVSPIIA